MVAPLKPATSVDQQIEILRSRGMNVDDVEARQWITNVGYYRLSAYWYPARIHEKDGERTDAFTFGTEFNQVIQLYEGDRKLRTLMHDGMERIEIAMRTRVTEHLCRIDPLSYRSPDHFRPSFEHSDWMNTAAKRIQRSRRHSESIRHYQKKYDGNYPMWVLADVLDFSDISKLYEGLPSHDQQEIAESLGIVIQLEHLSKAQRNKLKKSHPLARWLEQLTVVRNSCAHHGRLWNRSFTPAPTGALRTLDGLRALPEGQSERIFGTILVMAYLLRTISPNTPWSARVYDLIAETFLPNKFVAPRALGIPVFSTFTDLSLDVPSSS